MRDAAGPYRLAVHRIIDRVAGVILPRDLSAIPSRHLSLLALPRTRTSPRDWSRGRSRSNEKNRTTVRIGSPIFPSYRAFNWIEIDTVVFECRRVPLESRPETVGGAYLDARVKIAPCRSARLFFRDSPIGCRDYRASRGNFPRILDSAWKNSDGYSQRGLV